jgi:P27 family predicted phage terminase small subunit
VVTELQALKIITTLDLNLLAAWCSATGDYIVAERRLRQEGLVTDSRDRGLVRNPWLLIRNKAIEQMVRLGSELGLSPASRPRLNVPVSVPSVGQPVPSRFPEMSLDDYLASRPEPVGRH